MHLNRTLFAICTTTVESDNRSARLSPGSTFVCLTLFSWLNTMHGLQIHLMRICCHALRKFTQLDPICIIICSCVLIIRLATQMSDIHWVKQCSTMSHNSPLSMPPAIVNAPCMINISTRFGHATERLGLQNNQKTIARSGST